jgi:hypothetical protein
MRIGIDLDETITAHPEFFSKLSHLWDDDVYIITLRDDKEEAIQDAEKHNIKFTDVILVDSCEDKARIIKEMDIKCYWDDMPEVLIHVENDVAVFLVRNDMSNFDFDDQKFVFSEETGKIV